MLRKLLTACMALGLAASMSASELQGVIADWECVKPMVKNGREQTLQRQRNCSMMKNWNRKAYGLITIDKKFYRLDDSGTGKIRQLLDNSPDKDNLKVVVTGDVQGGTIKVSNISML